MTETPSTTAGLQALAVGFLRYFGAAAAALAVDWGTWLALWHATGHPVAAQAASRAVGGVVAFGLMRALAFRASDAPVSAQAGRYAVAWAASWLVSVALVQALSGAVTPPVAKIATDGVTFVANYAVARLWVFRVP